MHGTMCHKARGLSLYVGLMVDQASQDSYRHEHGPCSNTMMLRDIQNL